MVSRTAPTGWSSSRSSRSCSARLSGAPLRVRCAGCHTRSCSASPRWPSALATRSALSCQSRRCHRLWLRPGLHAAASAWSFRMRRDTCTSSTRRKRRNGAEEEAEESRCPYPTLRLPAAGHILYFELLLDDAWNGSDIHVHDVVFSIDVDEYPCVNGTIIRPWMSTFVWNNKVCTALASVGFAQRFNPWQREFNYAVNKPFWRHLTTGETSWHPPAAAPLDWRSFCPCACEWSCARLTLGLLVDLAAGFVTFRLNQENTGLAFRSGQGGWTGWRCAWVGVGRSRTAPTRRPGKQPSRSPCACPRASARHRRLARIPNGIPNPTFPTLTSDVGSYGTTL